jgi:hypothetical protein
MPSGMLSEIEGRELLALAAGLTTSAAMAAKISTLALKLLDPITPDPKVGGSSSVVRPHGAS